MSDPLRQCELCRQPFGLEAALRECERKRVALDACEDALRAMGVAP